MITIDPGKITVQQMHNYLLGAVTPRPIALASTVDRQGNVNLSPFSFFNCFGANPPLLVFSPSRRVRDNTTKHTYENILEVPQVVIHIVNYNIVQQTSLSSTEYEKGIDEFVKSGFTPEPSVKIKPPRVKESPIAMECVVKQVLSSGVEGGAGNLVICEVVLMHIADDILDEQGKIDPFKLDAVARLGGDWYARIHGQAIFKVPKPVGKLGIGIDRLPEFVRNSKVLTGNDLGQLANVEQIPEPSGQSIQLDALQLLHMKGEDEVHRFAQKLIGQGNVSEAWQVLLYKTKGPV